MVGVFDRVEVRWILVKWEGCEEPEWEREHLLRCDEFHVAIRAFWTRSELSAEKAFYDDEVTNRCDVCELQGIKERKT